MEVTVKLNAAMSVRVRVNECQRIHLHFQKSEKGQTYIWARWFGGCQSCRYSGSDKYASQRWGDAMFLCGGEFWRWRRSRSQNRANNALAWLLKPADRSAELNFSEKNWTSKTIPRHLNVTSDTPLNLQLKITNIRFSKCGKRTYKSTAERHWCIKLAWVRLGTTRNIFMRNVWTLWKFKA